MTLKCARRDLRDAVQIVARAAAPQSALPVHSHLLLVLEDGRLSVSATDGDLSSRTSIPVEGALEEGISVPARVIGELLASLPEGQLEITSSMRHTITLREGAIKFDLKGLPAEEFPRLPVVDSSGDDTLALKLDQKVLRRMLRQTLFCVGQEPTRHQYTGVLFEREGDLFRMVSTDGVVRVAVSSTQLGEPGPPIATIVPERTLQEVLRVLKPESSDPALIYFRSDSSGPRLVSFQANGVTLVSPLIEGQFAPWRRVVPAGCQESAILSSTEILGALKRMAILAPDDQERVQLLVSADGLKLFCHSDLYGDAEEKIPAVSQGGEVLIALHCRYLSEGIAALDRKDCRIELTTSLSPCVIREPEGSSFLYVQSPMHPR